MFKYLKDKLKGAIGKFSKDVEEEATIEEVAEQEAESSQEKPAGTIEVPEQEEKEQPAEEEPQTPQEKPAEAKETPEEPLREHKEQPVEEEPQKKAELKKPAEEQSDAREEDVRARESTTTAPAQEEKQTLSAATEAQEPPSEKRSFFGRVFTKKEEKSEEEPPAHKKEGFLARMAKVTLSEDKFEDLFWELEVTLLENNVAVEVIEKIKHDLKEALAGERVARKGVEQLIIDTLKETISEILTTPTINLLEEAERKKPLIIAMIGVNGSGKTTTLAKLAKRFQDQGKSVVVAAADTFRAAAIQQLEEHTNKLGVKLIKHDYNADPAAVAYDAVKHATAKGLDVVLIDSAGRLHSNDNLMNELKKLIRINKPDINLFVGEAVTGNDCVEQAKLFDEAVGIDGIILAKADVDEKGGAAISASYVTKKPVLFLGTGQTYEDLTPFKPEVVLESLGL